MRLLACKIENFGKISDFTYDFSEGLNVINEENGWGKSTFAAFLKVMFYGFESKKEKEALDKERALFQPWQGGVYGGELDFSIGEKRYRILRSFGKTPKTDQFQLFDLDTNLESKDYSEKIGEEIFDLDGASFKRSICMMQNEVLQVSSDGIHAKLGNLVEAAGDMNHFEMAMANLKDSMNKMSPDRITGSIKKRKGEIGRLMEEIKELESAANGFEAYHQKLIQQEHKRKELKAKRSSLQGELEKVIAFERRVAEKDTLSAFKAQEEQRKLELNELSKSFPGEIPSQEVLQQLLEQIQQLEQWKLQLTAQCLSDEEQKAYERLKELGEQSSTIIPEQEGASPNEEIPEGPEFQEKAGVLRLVSVVAGLVVVLLSSVAFLKLSLPTAIGVALLLVVVALVAVLLLRKHLENRKRMLLEETERIRRLRMEEQRLEQEKRLQEARILELQRQLDRQNLSQLEQKVRNYHLAEEMVSNQRQLLEGGLAIYGVSMTENPREELGRLQSLRNRYDTALSMYHTAKGQREQYFVEHPYLEREYSEEEKTFSAEELTEKIRQLDVEIEEVSDSLESYRRQLEDLQEQLDQKDLRMQELEEAKLLQKEEMEKYHIMELTATYLQEAREQVIAKYMEPISKGFRRYYESLVEDEKSQWIVDANMELKVKEQGQYRDPRWLSEGWQDVIGFCMRLALVQAMYPNEKPFLILDDPFVNLDQEKMKHAMELLKDVAIDYQTIYFSCHDSRIPNC